MKGAKNQNPASVLRQCLGKAQLVKVVRPLNPHPLFGCVVAMSGQFVIVHHLNDDFRQDGFHAFQISTITEVELLSENDVKMIAFHLLGHKPGLPGDIDLTDMGRLLQSVSDEWGHVCILLERRASNELFIGVVSSIKNGQLHLDEVDTQGEFDKRARYYELSQITRVQYGGSYETTVCTVGRERRKGISKPPR